MHVFGDFLGSIGVMISTAVILICRIYAPPVAENYTIYIDPVISIIIAAILFFPTLPLVIRCAKVLMQSVPESVQLPQLKEQLLNIPSVIGVHDLHVWSLIRNKRVIGSVHLMLFSTEEPQLTTLDQKRIAKKAKKIFHKFGVHSSTIQMEFAQPNSMSENCKLICDKECVEEWCCKPEQSQHSAKTAPTDTSKK